MPDKKTIRDFKLIRILELILLVVMLIVFLVHMTRMLPSNVGYAEYFDMGLVALTYVTLGGFVLVCIIDLVCQYTMEPISQKPMCVICIMAFILFMTVGIISIKNYQQKISLGPAHHSNATHIATPSTAYQRTEQIGPNYTSSTSVQKQVFSETFNEGAKDNGTYKRDYNSSGTKVNKRSGRVLRQVDVKPNETFVKKPGLLLFFGILSLLTSFVYLLDALVYIRSMGTYVDLHSRVYPVIPTKTSVTGDKGIQKRIIELETLYKNKNSQLGRSDSFPGQGRQTYSFDNHALSYMFTKHDDFYEKSPKYSMKHLATERQFNTDFLTDKSMTTGLWPQQRNHDLETGPSELDDIKSICILPDCDMDIIADARENRPPTRQTPFLFYGASTSKEKQNSARTGNILNDTFVRDFERQFNILSAYPVLTYSNPSDNNAVNYYDSSSSNMSKKELKKMQKAQKQAEKRMKKERKAAEKRAKKEAKMRKKGKSGGGGSELPRNGDGVVRAPNGTITLEDGQRLPPGDWEQIGPDGKIQSRSCCGTKWRKKTRRHLSRRPRQKKKGREPVTVVGRGSEPVRIVELEPTQQMAVINQRAISQENQLLISSPVQSREQLFISPPVQSREHLLLATRVPSRELCHCGGYANVNRRTYVQPEVQTVVQRLPTQDMPQYAAVPPDGICCMCERKIRALNEQGVLTRQNTSHLEVEKGNKLCFQRRSSPKLKTIETRTEYVKQGPTVEAYPPVMLQGENIQTVYSRKASPVASQQVVTSSLKSPHHGDCICDECLCVETSHHGTTILAPYQGDGNLQSVYVRPELNSARHPDNCICSQCMCDTDGLIVTQSRGLITTSNASPVYASPVGGGNRTYRNGIVMRDVGIMVDTCKCCDCIKPAPIFQQEIFQEQVAPVVMGIARERERICCCRAVIKAPSIPRVEVAMQFVTPRARKSIDVAKVPLELSVPKLRQTLWQNKVMTKTAVQSETRIRVNNDLLATMELRCRCGRPEQNVVVSRQTSVQQYPTSMSPMNSLHPSPIKLPCHCCTCNDQMTESVSVPASRSQVQTVFSPVQSNAPRLSSCNETNCGGVPRDFADSSIQQSVYAPMQSSAPPQSSFCDPECTGLPRSHPGSRQQSMLKSSRQPIVMNAAVLQSSPMCPVTQSDNCDTECDADCSNLASRQQSLSRINSSRQPIVMSASVLQSSPMSPLAQSGCDPKCTASPCSSPPSRQSSLPRTMSSRQQLVMNDAAVLQGEPMERSSCSETDCGALSRQQSRIRTNASAQDIDRMLGMLDEPVAARESQLSTHASVHSPLVVEEPETICACDDIIESCPAEVVRDGNEHPVESSTTKQSTSARRTSSTAAKRPKRPASTSPVKSRGPKKCEGKSTFSSYGGTFHVSKDVAPISSRRDASPRPMPYYHVHDICCQPIQQSCPGGPCPCDVPATQPSPSCQSPVAVCPLGHAHNIGAVSRRDGTTRNFFIYPVSVEREVEGDVAATRISLPASPASSEEWVNVPGYLKPSARKTWAKRDSEEEFRLTTRDTYEGCRETVRSEGEGGMSWLGRSRRVRPGKIQIEEVRDIAIEIDASNLMIPQVADVKRVEPMQIATSWFMGSMNRR